MPTPGKDYPDPKDPKQVRPHGTIIGPGKFEGEMYYVPYFWDQAMDGGDTVDDPEGMTYSVVEFTAEDRKEFPEGWRLLDLDVRARRRLRDRRGRLGEARRAAPQGDRQGVGISLGGLT